MGQAIFIISCVLLLVAISWTWVDGITYMRENHPDYKGEDLFDDNPPKKEEWDDNKQHTEQDFK